MNHKTNIVQV